MRKRFLGTDHEKSYGGGGGEFSSSRNFFRYQILMKFFQALAWIFLRVNWRARIFFHLIFPCANFFFVLRPPPHKFSNGPSLTPDGVMNKLACVAGVWKGREGKGSCRRESNARGAQGGRENKYKHSITNVSVFRVISFTLSAIFYGSEIRHEIFLSFAPIRLSLSIEIRSTPSIPPWEFEAWSLDYRLLPVKW